MGIYHFPDSATKTAQALMDFSREEELPLFILANWRGFSGGQRDLFEGELRGGAWVVVDSKINSDHIEMYAERTAKGNVLEPEGMIEIKFRTRELLECMGRLDQQLIDLKAKLHKAKSTATHAIFEDLQRQIKSREKQLLPLYTQIATKFAELHDTSLRMAAKGVVREVVKWSNSRSFFYKRLRRRVVEDSLITTVVDAAGYQLAYKSAREMIEKWFLDSEIAGGNENSWMDDETFFSWKDDPRNYEENIPELRVRDSTMDLPQGLSALLKRLNWNTMPVDPSIREQLIDELKRVLK